MIGQQYELRYGPDPEHCLYKGDTAGLSTLRHWASMFAKDIRPGTNEFMYVGFYILGAHRPENERVDVSQGSPSDRFRARVWETEERLPDPTASPNG